MTAWSRRLPVSPETREAEVARAVAGAGAAADLDAETVAGGGGGAAEAERLAQAGVDDPVEVAVLRGVIILRVATVAGDAVLRGKEPFGELVRAHAAFFIKGLLRDGIELPREIARLGLPAA